MGVGNIVLTQQKQEWMWILFISGVEADKLEKLGVRRPYTVKGWIYIWLGFSNA